jgi:outer membrane immunogenic protein
MKKLFFGAVALTGLMGSAFAADLPLYKAPPPAPVYSWTGFYLGANVGYGMSMDKASSNTLAGNGDIVVAPGTQLYGGPQNFDLAAKGWSGGGQLGYNLQWTPSWVIGFETDIQGQSMSDSQACIMACNTPTAINFSQGAVRFPVMFGNNSSGYNIDWFGTVRGRLGYTFGPSLLYVTGGLAYGNVQTNSAVAGNTFFAGNGATVNNFSGAVNTSGTKTGWVLGAGIEAALWSNWTVKAEYLYMDFGSVTENYNTVFTSSVFGQTGQTAGIRTVTNEITEQVFRVGLNYKFGAPIR